MDINSRRKLLQTGIAAALVAASGFPLAAQARAVGGRLRVGVSDGTWLDQAGQGSAPSAFRMIAGQGAIFDTLTEVTSEGSLQGELALEWRSSRDARVWDIRLREDAVFHCGAAFGAEDVVASVLHQRATGETVLQAVSSVTAVGAHHVRFVLREGNPDWPWLLSHPNLVMRRSADLRAGVETANGTGLFRLADREAGKRLIAKRVARHYKDGRAGWFDELELLVLPDAEQRAAALRSGRVDVVHDLSEDQIARFASDARFKLHTVPDSAYIALDLRGEDAPQVAAALKQVLDRDRLVSEALGPFGHPGADLPLPGRKAVSTRGGPTELPGALTVALEPGLGAAGARVVSALARQLKGHGVAVALASSTDEATLVARSRPVWPNQDWTWSEWAAQGGVTDDEIAVRLARARAELDAEARQGHYDALADTVPERSCILVPCFVAHTLVSRSNLEIPGDRRPLMMFDGGRLAERWWRA